MDRNIGAMSDILSYVPPSLPGWLGAGGVAGVGFAFAKWLLEYVGGRMDKRAAALDQDTRFVIENLKAEVGRLLSRVEVLEHGLAECHSKHAAAEAELARHKAILQARGEIRERAQLIVAAERTEERRQGQNGD